MTAISTAIGIEGAGIGVAVIWLIFDWIAVVKIDKKHGYGWSIYLLVHGIIGLADVALALVRFLMKYGQYYSTLRWMLGIVLSLVAMIFYVVAFSIKRKEVQLFRLEREKSDRKNKNTDNQKVYTWYYAEDVKTPSGDLIHQAHEAVSQNDSMGYSSITVKFGTFVDSRYISVRPMIGLDQVRLETLPNGTGASYYVKEGRPNAQGMDPEAIESN